MSRVVVSLCDLTGNFVQPWVEAGYQAWARYEAASANAARQHRELPTASQRVAASTACECGKQTAALDRVCRGCRGRKS